MAAQFRQVSASGTSKVLKRNELLRTAQSAVPNDSFGGDAIRLATAECGAAPAISDARNSSVEGVTGTSAVAIMRHPTD